MDHSSGETPNVPETDKQVVIEKLEALLAPHDWQEYERQISWLGNGTLREGKFRYTPVYDGPTYSENRTTRYRRNRKESIEKHQIIVHWEVGQDSEGRTSTLITNYTVDLLSNTLEVTQAIGIGANREQATSYSHFGIQDKPKEDQWRQLLELLNAQS